MITMTTTNTLKRFRLNVLFNSILANRYEISYWRAKNTRFYIKIRKYDKNAPSTIFFQCKIRIFAYLEYDFCSQEDAVVLTIPQLSSCLVTRPMYDSCLEATCVCTDAWLNLTAHPDNTHLIPSLLNDSSRDRRGIALCYLRAPRFMPEATTNRHVPFTV